MKEIINTLSNIQKPGSFFSKGSVAAENLALAIAGQNQLKWPLSKQATRQLISLAKPAHFGWRDKTLLDKKIRDVWEISQKNIRIGNKAAWNKTLLAALNTVKTDLGLPENAKMQAKLHNLLIYEPGQFFHPHQDSEKYDGMVATMVIVLPSVHTGGGLVIDHQGEKKTIQSSQFSSDNLNFIAFYADCYHEVKPIKTGYRVALTYNLILENAARPSKKIDKSNSTKNRLIQPLRNFFILEDDQNSSEVTSKCVYLLDHQYTKAGLSWRHLKNIDRLRATALRQAADQLDLNIYLALADIHECWNCEGDYDDNYWSNRRYNYDYDIDHRKVTKHKEASIELVDLIEESISLRHWVDHDGNTIDLAECSMNTDEIGWTKATDAFKPFESEYEGWMGNYGNTLDRWYHRAAIVLWQKANHYRVLFQIDPDRVMHDLISSTKPKASPLPISEILTSLLPLWSKYISSWDATLFKKVLQLAIWVENPDLSQKMLQDFTIQALTPQTAKKCLTIIRLYGVSWFLELLHTWTQPKNRWASTSKCEHITKLISTLGDNNPSHQALVDFLLEYQWQQLNKYYSIDKNKKWKVELLSHLEERIQNYYELLEACKLSQCETMMMKIINHLISDGRVYPPLDLIVLLDVCTTSSHQKLLVYISSELKKEYEQGLLPSNNWSINEKIFCSCLDCIALDKFLRSPLEKTKVWPLAQDRRQHIHQTIDNSGLPVSHKTQRTGSPFKLILTKTELLHRQAKERFIKIEKALSRLTGKVREPAF